MFDTVWFIAILAIGSLITTLAMEGESKPWRKPLVMAMGFLLTVLALGGVLLARAGK